MFQLLLIAHLIKSGKYTTEMFLVDVVTGVVFGGGLMLYLRYFDSIASFLTWLVSPIPSEYYIYIVLGLAVLGVVVAILSDKYEKH